jgi:ribonuclease HI
MILFTDGASRGNPGPAGIGFVLQCDDITIIEDGYYLGNRTNNVAEMTAILISLFIIKEKNITRELIIKSDSLLLINQFKGIYKIKNEVLQAGHLLFEKQFASFFRLSFLHIERAYNKRADALANKGIDEKKILSEECSSFIAPMFLQK